MTPRRPWEALYPPGLRWDMALPMCTLPALLDRAASRFGPRTAIRCGETALTFHDLHARVERLARGLAAIGVRAGDRVALLLPNGPLHPVAFFAVLRLGAVVVHLTPLDPPRASRRKLEDSTARTLITAAALPQAEALRDAVDRLVLDGELPDGPAADWPGADPGDIALLQYTGGTTGAPRGACLTHTNLTAAVAIYDAWNDGWDRAFRPGDRVLGVLPLFHIYALTAVLLRCIANGVELVLHARFDTAAVLDAIEHGRSTHMSGVPTMWIAIANHAGVDRRDLSSLRVISSGGASLPHEVAGRVSTLTGLRMGGGWGMTETSPAGTNLLPGREAVPGEIGVPLPGVELQIVALDDPRRVLPPGEAGELRVRGPNVTPGYWRRPEETAAAFVDGWFLTGDVGRMEADGRFVLADRKKDMIISGGFNVYPLSIEAAIHEHPDVAEAAVIGIPDPYRGQAAKAFVTLRDGAAPLTLDGLRAFLAERLGRHELPSALELRDSLPRTPVGKLSKKDLLAETT